MENLQITEDKNEDISSDENIGEDQYGEEVDDIDIGEAKKT